MRINQRIPVLSLLLLGVIFTLISCSSNTTDDSPSMPQGEHPDPEPFISPSRNSEPILGCDSEMISWVTDQNVYPVPVLMEPDARKPFLDPTFNTCVVRVTDRYTDISPEGPSEGLKNEYSRVQSFNLDGSLLIARTTEANWYLYDALSLEHINQLPLGVEPRWDVNDPHRIYHFDEGRLFVLDLASGQNQLVHDFTDVFPGHNLSAVWTRYEGSPSFDGRYWGLMAQDQDWNLIGLLVYDLVSDQVIAHRELGGVHEIDAVTISPLGTYLLVYYDVYCESGQTGDEDHPCGLMVFDRDLENGRSVVPIIGHSDTALNTQGREVVVFQDIRNDEISYIDLESGQVVPLFPIDFRHSPIGLHFSGRAKEKPGWSLISTYSGAQPSATWMDDGVFAIELKPGGRIVRLAHTHSVVDEDQEHDYWAEPQASVNFNFTRILFTSNWGRSGSPEVEIYMIILPQSNVFDLP